MRGGITFKYLVFVLVSVVFIFNIPSVEAPVGEAPDCQCGPGEPECTSPLVCVNDCWCMFIDGCPEDPPECGNNIVETYIGCDISDCSGDQCDEACDDGDNNGLPGFCNSDCSGITPACTGNEFWELDDITSDGLGLEERDPDVFDTGNTHYVVYQAKDGTDWKLMLYDSLSDSSSVLLTRTEGVDSGDGIVDEAFIEPKISGSYIVYITKYGTESAVWSYDRSNGFLHEVSDDLFDTDGDDIPDTPVGRGQHSNVEISGHKVMWLTDTSPTEIYVNDLSIQESVLVVSMNSVDQKNPDYYTDTIFNSNYVVWQETLNGDEVIYLNHVPSGTEGYVLISIPGFSLTNPSIGGIVVDGELGVEIHPVIGMEYGSSGVSADEVRFYNIITNEFFDDTISENDIELHQLFNERVVYTGLPPGLIDLYLVITGQTDVVIDTSDTVGPTIDLSNNQNFLVWNDEDTLDIKSAVVQCPSSCCYVHGTPGCDDQICEDIVCEFDNNYCCENPWDVGCVGIAELYCEDLDCSVAFCGNGNIDGGEECDHGDENGIDGECTIDCQLVIACEDDKTIYTMFDSADDEEFPKYNSHVALIDSVLYDPTIYTIRVCSDYTVDPDACGGGEPDDTTQQVLFWLFSDYNSHASKNNNIGNVGDGSKYPVPVCYNDKYCEYVEGNEEVYDSECETTYPDYECLGSISSGLGGYNAHVGACEEFATKICCGNAALPGNCEFTDAYWADDAGVEIADAVEGETVQLIVEGTGCDGQLVDFEIGEYDIILDYVVETITDTFDRTTWQAIWELDDCPVLPCLDDDPEYKFIASLFIDSSVDFQSDTLDVSPLGGGGGEECGDGEVNAGEECDDGNDVPDDGCTDCIEDDGWDCDSDPDECYQYCGNGILDDFEIVTYDQVCDDLDNADPGDDIFVGYLFELGCENYGFDAGDLICAGDCQIIDTSGCEDSEGGIGTQGGTGTTG